MDEGDFAFHNFLFHTSSRVSVNYLCGYLFSKDGTEGTTWSLLISKLDLNLWPTDEGLRVLHFSSLTSEFLPFMNNS